MQSELTIENAAALLRAGNLVAFPTETVYGLGADARNDQAVAKIYALKSRPQFNPLIVHVPDATTARSYVEWDARAEKLAARFWPGALTLVLPRRSECGISLLASAGLDTLAVRVPAHTIAQSLLQASNVPIAAPSANRSGRVSPTQAAHVRAEFGDDVPVIDGGVCEVGVESTVVDLTTKASLLLRPGSVTPEQLSEALGTPVQHAGEDAALHAPGMLKSHYAPMLPVRLNVTAPQAGEVWLTFGPAPAAADTYSLSESGDLAEAAAKLFALLRAADQQCYTGIAVMPIPEHGIGLAINDRLQRASVR